jgi:hypothetical protein
MQLDARLRRLSTYLYVQELLKGRVVELGATDGRTQELLGRLLGGRGTVEQRPEATRSGLGDAMADVVLALDLDPAAIDGVVTEARRILKPEGVLVVGCESRDRPGAKRGVSYYDLVDRVEGKFAAVAMIGQAPFAGATLVEYGVKDPEPVLDGTLVEKGERVEWYVAIAGPPGRWRAATRWCRCRSASSRPRCCRQPRPRPSPLRRPPSLRPSPRRWSSRRRRRPRSRRSPSASGSARRRSRSRRTRS